MNRSKRVSIKDVARRAGVSIATVSRVINKSPTVHPRNRRKVEEAIAALNYRPDVNAQRLAKGVNHTIGLVMPGYPGIFHSFYAIELLRGVGHACEMLQLDLMFHITNGRRPVNHSAVGGVIFADIIENEEEVRRTLEDGVPCIVVNHLVRNLNTSYIAVDNFEGGKMVADYLLDLGHTRIAIVTGNVNTQSGRHRLDGFKHAFAERQISFDPHWEGHGDYSRRSAREGLMRLLKLKQRPTAVFFASDEMALEGLAVAVEQGIRVPAELSIVGFDDNPAALYGPVALTTVRQPLFEMGQDAVRYLHQVVIGRKRNLLRRVMSPQLIVRESCAPLT